MGLSSWLKRLFLILLCGCTAEVPDLLGDGQGTVVPIRELAGSRGPSKKGKPNKPRGRPVSKGRCLDSAAAGGVVWTAFCRDIKDASVRKRCFEVGLESEQRRTGFCNNFF